MKEKLLQFTELLENNNYILTTDEIESFFNGTTKHVKNLGNHKRIWIYEDYNTRAMDYITIQYNPYSDAVLVLDVDIFSLQPTL